MGRSGRFLARGGAMGGALMLAAQAAAVQPQPQTAQSAPSGPSSIQPLPPSTYDPALLIGGADIKARKVESRLTVDVQVNGRGPYRFVVDSGADTSVIGAGLA